MLASFYHRPEPHPLPPAPKSSIRYFVRQLIANLCEPSNMASVNRLRYPKASEAFSYPLFSRPSNEYKGSPFWSLNTSLAPNNVDRLLQQIHVFKKMGMGGFHAHSRIGLESEYLGEDYMYFIQKSVKVAREEGMLAGLYDEDR